MAAAQTQEARDAIDGDTILTQVAAGMTIAQVARKNDMAYERTRTLYHRELAAVHAENSELRKTLVARELRTLDLLQRKFMVKALEDGDEKAARIVLDCTRERSALLELKAATKVALEITAVDDALQKIVQIIDGDYDVAAPLMRVLPAAG